MHRQKSIHSGRGKLFRKMELTAREGTRHRRAVHFHGCGPQTGTADGYPPVPNEGAESIALRAEEHRAPSAHAFLQRPQGSHASMPVPSWRRCYYAQSACLVVHLDLRSKRSGYFDVWSMGHLHGSVALMCVARSGDVASSGRLSSMAWAFEQWAAWFASGLDWVQLVSRCGFVCGARTPRAIATSFIACIHRGERGRMFASAGGPVGSLWAAPAVRNGHCMSCGRCRGGRALAGDVKGRYMGAPKILAF